MASMTWNEFRSQHKGVPQSEISELWKEYKAGNYNIVEPLTAEEVEETMSAQTFIHQEVIEENPDLFEGGDVEDGAESESEIVVEETSDEEVEAEEEEEVTPIPEPTPEPEVIEVEPIEKFAELMNLVFGNSKIDSKERSLADAELHTLADSLRGVEYACARTDGWKLWIGPTSKAVLVNETKNVAFACNREYWQRFYHGASMCYVDTVSTEKQVLDMKKFYQRQNVFVNRVPVPGYEIMLPSSRLEIVNTASLQYK